MNLYKGALKTFAVAMLLLAFGLTATAQTSKGFIVGTVVDQNGAVVANAAIKATNIATGTSRSTVTTEEGKYRLDAVDPGTYTIEVTATGFAPITRDNVVVAATQTADISIQLSVGATTATVDVSGSTGVELQTTDGTRSNTLDQRQITELPVAGLNPVDLVYTLPGVADASRTLSGGFVQGTEFSVNGLRPRSNNQLIDGLDNNDNSISGQFYQPTVRDGYDEVAILQSNYSAEFGRAGGAIVNVTTRRGTNSFHGSFYDIIQNSAFNSLTPGEKRRGLTEVPQFSENTLGGSFGGPIVRNKLFFFGTFQADLFRSNAEATAVVPTAAGFNTLRTLFPAGTNANVDYYLGIVGANRGVTSPFLVSLGSGRPAVEFGTVSFVAPQPVDTYDYIGRVDFTPTDRDSMSFRYLSTKQTFFNQFPTVFSGFEVDVPSLIQNFYYNYTRQLSNKATNEFRFGYGRFNALFLPRNEAVGQSGPAIAFAGSGLDRGVTGVGLSASFPQGRIFNNFQFQDTLSYTTGNHTLRGGVDLNVQRSKQFVPFNSRGTLTFSSGGGFTALGNFVDNFSGAAGASAASRVYGSQVVYPDAFYQNYFINDEWRVRPNFTLNLGLRYENYGTPFNVVTNPAFSGFDQPFNAVVRQRRDNNNFAPRFSFAYTPDFASGFGRRLFGESNTVIRGGFAVNYDFFFNNILSNTAAASPNVAAFALNATSNPASRGTAGFGINVFPASGTFNPLNAITTVGSDLVNPQTYVYNFGIQRRLPGNFIADVAYVGSRGTRLFINEQLNPRIDGGARLVPTRGSITVRTNGGDSTYNSLQARLERGFANHFFLRASYTFSKAIDNVNSEVFLTTGGASVGSDPFNRRVDRSVASYDVPHVGSLTFLFDVPTFGTTGFARSVLGGWTLGTIYRIQSGAVETAYVGGLDLNGDGSAFNDRPILNNPNAPANSVAITNDTAEAIGIGYNEFDVFVPSPTGFFFNSGEPGANGANSRYIIDIANRNGIVGRNTLRGPLFNRLDVSLQRAFGLNFIREGVRFEVRADFFNVLNHPNFTPGTGDVFDTNFNDPYTFGEGSRRTGRIQLRFSF